VSIRSGGPGADEECYDGGAHRRPVGGAATAERTGEIPDRDVDPRHSSYMNWRHVLWVAIGC